MGESVNELWDVLGRLAAGGWVILLPPVGPAVFVAPLGATPADREAVGRYRAALEDLLRRGPGTSPVHEALASWIVGLSPEVYAWVLDTAPRLGKPLLEALVLLMRRHEALARQPKLDSLLLARFR